MNSAENYVRQKLFEMQDSDYRDFHSRLMPTVDKEKVIGIRTPVLRAFAKKLFDYEDFLNGYVTLKNGARIKKLMAKLFLTKTKAIKPIYSLLYYIVQ